MKSERYLGVGTRIGAHFRRCIAGATLSAFALSGSACNRSEALPTAPTTTPPTPPVSCTYSLSASSFVGYPNGGSFDIAVTAGAGCAWSAVSGTPWLHVRGTGTGRGNGTFAFGVDANTTSAPRTGAISIENRTLTFNQAAAMSSLPPTPVPVPAACTVAAWACSSGNTFGAIAYSPSGRSGWSYSFATRSAAEARAIQECGASDCRVGVWFQGQCGALARTPNGLWTHGLGSSQAAAEAAALSSCRAGQQGPSLPQPACVPNVSGTTNVPIRNTTSYTVAVTFTGSVTRSATIRPGMAQMLALPPGSYRATGEVLDANGVRFEPSTWTVAAGCDYPLEIVSH